VVPLDKRQGVVKPDVPAEPAEGDRSSSSNILTWVTRISDGTPVSNARVTVKSSSNQVLATGKTDRDGLFKADYTSRVPDEPPYLVVVRKGSDRAFVDEERFDVNLTNDALSGRPYVDEGRLRVMVLASGARRMGGAGTDLIVKAPLGVRLATPRFLAPGDQPHLPVTIRNSTGSKGTLDLSFRTDGPLSLADNASPHSTLTLSNGQQQTIPVAVRTGDKCGPGRLVCEARLNGEQRTVTKSIPVRPRSYFDVRRIGFSVFPGTYTTGPLIVQSMYNPNIRAIIAGDETVRIRAQQ